MNRTIRDPGIDASGEGSPRAQFIEAMSRLAASVSVVTTAGPAGMDGLVVSSLTPVSADTPEPSLLICVNRASRAFPKIVENGVFCVNLLHEAQSCVADRFAGRAALPPGDWFADLPWRRLSTGAPALDGASASFDCALTGTVEMGSHHVIFGGVQALRFGEGARPLLYGARRYGALAEAPISSPTTRPAGRDESHQV